MILDSTIMRLRWHADLEELPDGGVSSVSSCLLPGAVDASALESALSDFVAALEILNHELNGAMPSERIAAEPSMLPATLVYAVTEVIRQLHQGHTRAIDDNWRQTLGRAAWRAEAAWSAVLAGDIDDIEAHLEEEEAARFD